MIVQKDEEERGGKKEKEEEKEGEKEGGRKDKEVAAWLLRKIAPRRASRHCRVARNTWGRKVRESATR